VNHFEVIQLKTTQKTQKVARHKDLPHACARWAATPDTLARPARINFYVDNMRKRYL
jgi:hypothetical protein